MKPVFLLAVLFLALASQGQQSLKDALFSGRLKNDSGSVLRKGEDLTTKMDSVSRVKPVEQTVVSKTNNPAGTNNTQTIANSNNSNVQNNTNNDNSNPDTAPVKSKDNNALWKDYMEELVTTLKEEVLSSNKIKAGTYYLLVNYEIGIDGEITVSSVASTPGNTFLQDQIKQRITLDAPKMNIELNQYGQPRKAVKRYNFTLTKS